MEIVSGFIFLGISIALILQEVQIKNLNEELFHMKNIIGMLSQMIPAVKDAKKLVDKLTEQYVVDSTISLSELDSEDAKALKKILGIEDIDICSSNKE